MSSLFTVGTLPLVDRLLGYGRFLDKLGMTMALAAAQPIRKPL